jgi:hypothetical protein
MRTNKKLLKLQQQLQKQDNKVVEDFAETAKSMDDLYERLRKAILLSVNNLGKRIHAVETGVRNEELGGGKRIEQLLAKRGFPLPRNEGLGGGERIEQLLAKLEKAEHDTPGLKEQLEKLEGHQKSIEADLQELRTSLYGPRLRSPVPLE